MNHPVKAIGIGAGGHAKVVLDILLRQKNFLIIGLLDTDTTLWDTTVLGIPVLGGDEKLDRLIAQENVSAFFIGLGAVKSLAHRKKLYENAISRGLTPIEIVDRSAYISCHALLGKGVAVLVSAIVNTACCLGENVIINTGAIVEHDCIIGNHVHIATGAHLAGGVEVGDESIIGIGSVIRQGIRIGKRSLVGAGAVVVKDVPDDCVVTGNPAKIMTGYGI